MKQAEIPEKRPRGRPAGSGAQLPAIERARKSRASRAESTKAGGSRLDFWLLGESAEQLVRLMQQWKSPHRKDAVERALDLAYKAIIADQMTHCETNTFTDPP